MKTVRAGVIAELLGAGGGGSLSGASDDIVHVSFISLIYRLFQIVIGTKICYLSTVITSNLTKVYIDCAIWNKGLTAVGTMENLVLISMRVVLSEYKLARLIPIKLGKSSSIPTSA